MEIFHPSNLERYLHGNGFIAEKHPTQDLIIYGCSTRDTPRKWDDVNIHLRGLIINSKGEILARSFCKFFTFKNYVTNDSIVVNEGRIIDLPNEEYRIFDKVDGTLAMLYWINSKPYLATQRSFSSKKAQKANEILYNKYPHTFKQLNPKKTYIFEVISRETRVVVDYGDDEDLILTAIIDTTTGENCELEEVGFPVAQEYSQLSKMVTDFTQLQNLNLANKEGFVIVYHGGLRIKIKFPWYREAHSYHQQLINYHRAIYQLQEKIRKVHGMPKNFLSKHKVWAELCDGYPLEKIMQNIQPAMHYVGIEPWIEQVYNEYTTIKSELANTNPNYSCNELREHLFTKKDMLFSKKSPTGDSFDLVMWNFFERIENSYHYDD